MQRCTVPSLLLNEDYEVSSNSPTPSSFFDPAAEQSSRSSRYLLCILGTELVRAKFASNFFLATVADVLLYVNPTICAIFPMKTTDLST